MSIESRGALIGSLIMLLCFFIQGILTRVNSPTYDEAMHLTAGYSYLATGDLRLKPQHPPLI